MDRQGDTDVPGEFQNKDATENDEMDWGFRLQRSH